MEVQAIVRQALEAKVLTLQQEAQLQAMVWEREIRRDKEERTAMMTLIVAVRAGEVRRVSRLFQFAPECFVFEPDAWLNAVSQ